MENEAIKEIILRQPRSQTSTRRRKNKRFTSFKMSKAQVFLALQGGREK